MNSVSLIGLLGEVDKEFKELRQLTVEREYSVSSSNIEDDKLYIMNWDKEAHGEIFSFKNNSLVAIKGRLETFQSRVVVIVESIRYLGFK